MLPLDYLYALCLVGVAVYLWQREVPRLLLTPVMLLSFFVLYGVGNIIYFLGADTVPDVHRAVTSSLILMWLGLIAGIELARGAMPSLAAQSARVIRGWRDAALSNRAGTDEWVAMVGWLAALFLLAAFLVLGKPGQLHTFFSLESYRDKQQFRLDFGGQGGYLYQLLLVSVAPFLSFLLLSKAAASRRRYLLIAGLALCAVVLAGKVATFQKVPWVIYLLQLIIARQLRRRLDISVGRIIVFVLVVLGGVVGAALIAIPEQLEAKGILEWLAYRFFEINNEGIYQNFYVYPQYLPHTWGMNIGLVHGLFGSGELLPAYAQVANFFGAVGSTFDAFFIADAWVDFGYPGVVLTAVLVGYVVKTVDIYITSLGKTTLTVAVIASGMYGLFQLEVNGALTAFFSGGLVLIPLLVLASQGLINDLAHGQRQWQR